MNSFRFDSQTVPDTVVFDDTTMYVVLRNGNKISTPLARFPRLQHGTSAERNQWCVIGAGDGLHWPLLDEDISVKALFAEKKEPLVGSQNISEVISIIGDIYAKSAELNRLSGRNFTPDGLFVSTTGQVVAEYIYGLKAQTSERPFATSQDGRTVKVALTGHSGTAFGIRWTEDSRKSHAELLLCLQLNKQGFREIYNGEFPIDLLRDRKISSTGQLKLSISALSELNPALLDKQHSFASINQLLYPKLADAA